jgi:hypothetical protein
MILQPLVVLRDPAELGLGHEQGSGDGQECDAERIAHPPDPVGIAVEPLGGFRERDRGLNRSPPFLSLRVSYNPIVRVSTAKRKEFRGYFRGLMNSIVKAETARSIVS